MFNISKSHQGVLYMLISAFFFAIMGAFAKILSSSLPTIEIVFFRNVFGVMVLIVLFVKSPSKQQGGKPFLLLFRGVIGFVAMLSFFYNIANIPLADAVTYSRISPVFTALFAMWFLKEHIYTKGWIAIFISFIGILFVMQPVGLLFNDNHFFGILNAVCAALAFTSIRELKDYYDIRFIVFSFMLTSTIASLIFMLFAEYYNAENLAFIMEKFVMPNSSGWLYIIALGISSFLGQIYMTKAYASTKAGIVGVISYSVIIFSLIIGLILGDSLPNMYSIIGIALIIFGGAVITSKHKA